MTKQKKEQTKQLNQTISLIRLAEAKGLNLEQHNNHYIAPCPWCNNDKFKLTIIPVTNEWSCDGKCKSGGNLIDFVMKIEGVSQRHACELLQTESELLFTKVQGRIAKKNTTKVIDSEFQDEVNDKDLLNRVIGYYHQTLKQSPDALGYLNQRGINHPEAIEHFRMGYSARKLGYLLPDKNRKQGALVRGQLQRIGIYRASGHEHFSGSLVVPVLSRDDVLQAYGRKIISRLRKGTPRHLFLPSAHVGVFNESALQHTKEIILCNSFVDAITFWVHGYRNVTSTFGCDELHGDLVNAITKYDVRRIMVAFGKNGDVDAVLIN